MADDNQSQSAVESLPRPPAVNSASGASPLVPSSPSDAAPAFSGPQTQITAPLGQPDQVPMRSGAAAGPRPLGMEAVANPNATPPGQKPVYSYDYAGKKAAMDQWQLGQDQDLHSTATDELGKQIQSAASSLRAKQGQADQYSNLLKQQDDLQTRAKAVQSRGWFQGSESTSDALAAKSQLDALNPQVDAFNKQGFGQLGKTGKEPKPVEDAKDFVKQLRDDHSTWSGAKPTSAGDLDKMIQDRYQALKTSGQDPNADSILSSIEARKKELGLPATTFAPLTPAAPTSPTTGQPRSYDSYQVAQDGKISFPPGKALQGMEDAFRRGDISKPDYEKFASSRALADQEISKDWTGNFPQGLYHVDPDKKLTFERGYTANAMISAYKDGAVAPDFIREHLADARKADEEYQSLMTAAGNNQRLKAFVDTGIKSYLSFQGGVAASAGVAPFDPELAALGAPVGGWGAVALPALVHGLAFLGGTFITKKATDALVSRASKYSDLINSLESSAQTQPGYAAVGEVAGMAPAAISSIAGFAKAADMIAQKDGVNAAVKFVSARLATGAGAGALFETAMRPAFDATLHATGLTKEEVHYPTFKSVAEATLIGSILNGEGLKDTFTRAANYSRNAGPETADLVKESVADAKKNGVSPEFRSFFGGIDPEIAGTTPEKVTAFAKSLGMEWKPVTKADATTPNEPTSSSAGPLAVAKPDIGAAHEEINNLSMPGKTPEEHGVTQTTLRALVKVGQGQPIESLTAAEKQAVTSKGPDGLARVEMVQGQPVITNGTLSRVRQIAPTTATLLPQTEEQQRAAILSQTETPPQQQSKPEVQEQKRPTSQEQLPTFSVEVQNAKGETEAKEVQAATEAEAKSQVAKSIKPGEGLVRDVTKIYEPQTANAQPLTYVPPERFADTIVEHVRNEAGRDLAQNEERTVRKLAATMGPSYERWSKAFSAVKGTLQKRGSAGASYGADTVLHISLPDLARTLHEQTDRTKTAGRIITEEAMHSVWTGLENRDPETGKSRGPIDVVKLYKYFGPRLKEAMRKVYKVSDASYNQAHEFFRMWAHGEAEFQGQGRIRLKDQILHEQSSRKFVQGVARDMAFVLHALRDMEAFLRKEGASPEQIREVRQALQLARAKIKEVDGHAASESKDKAGEITPKQTGGLEQARERAPPKIGKAPEPSRSQPTTSGAGRAGEPRSVPKDVGGAAKPVARRELGESATPASTSEGLSGGAVERRLSPEGRAALSTAFRIPEGAVGNQSQITQNGRTLDVAYVTQEAAEARPSHDIQGRANPLYDQSLQPRERSLPSYRKQAQNIANSLDFKEGAFFPGTNTPATTTDIGPPIMLKHGDTLIGNGREIGIKAAYDQNLPSAARYKTDFIRNAHTFGINPATVRNMKQPILKRVILNDLPKDDLIRFSQESNAPTAMASNALEVAAQDSTRLNPQILSLFDPNYDLSATKNQSFIQAYLRDVVGGTQANLPNLTGAELARRIRAAVFTYAYGADDTGRAALERLAGDEGSEGKTITNGLLTVAPLMARIRNDVASGDLHSGMDVSQSITRAAQDISQALSERPKNQSAKAAVESLLGQGQLFVGSPLEYEALRFFVNNRNKRIAIEEGLSNYAEAVFRLGSPKDGELFAGEREIPTAVQLFVKSTSNGAIERKEALHTLAAQQINEQFALEKPESVEEQKARLEKEMVAQEKKAQRSEIERRAEAPLEGTTGDIGQGSLFDKEDIFSFTPDLKAQATALQTLRSQPISDDGERIWKVAIKTHDGEIHSGINHWDAANNLTKEQFDDGYYEGFITSRGRFLSRNEAFDLISSYRTIPLTVVAPYLDSNLAGSLDVLGSQQLNLFEDYASSLPAKAKVSKPVLKQTVEKELHALSDNEKALDDLMKLANHERQEISVQNEGEPNALNQQISATSDGNRGTQPVQTEQGQPGITQNVQEEAPRLREHSAQGTPEVRPEIGRGQLTAQPITFVRHGTTTLNGESGTSPDRIRGHTDVPLDTNGRRQAIKAGRDLDNSGITKVFASDLSRSRETAELMASQIKGKPPVTPEFGLRPWALGNEIEGQQTSKVMPEIHRLLDNPDEPAKGGGESFNTFKDRFLSTVDQIRSENPGDNVAIVTHFRGLKLLKSVDQAGNLDVAEFKKKDDTIPPGSALAENELRSQPLTDEDRRFNEGLPLANRIAGRFDNIRGVQPGDIQSRAQTALLRAARSFDPNRGSFLPFARAAINNDLKRLYREQNRGPVTESLEAPINETGQNYSDIIPGREDTVQDVFLGEGGKILSEVISELPQRMGRAINAILEGESLESVGRETGISRQAVSRLAIEGMRRLKGKLGERVITSASDLLSQIITDELKSQETENPIEHLMSMLKDDPIEKLRGIPGIGDAGLALGSEPGMRAAHEFHSQTQTPQTIEGWDKKSDEILADRGNHWADDVIARWTSGSVLDPSEVRATQKWLIKRQQEPMTDVERRQYDTAAYAYTKIGEATARALASRVDPFKTPEDRNREFMAKALVRLTKSQERELSGIASNQTKIEQLEAMIEARRKAINAALERVAGQGVTIDDILSGATELRLKGAKIIENQLGSYSDKEQKALRLAQNGTRSAADIAKAVGLSEKAVQDLNDRFISDLENKLMAKTRAGATLENLDPEMLLAQPTDGELGSQAISEDQARAEARKMIKAMGFVASKDLGRFKVKQQKRKLFVPPKPAGPPVEAPTSEELPYPQPAEAPYTGRVLGQPGLPLYQEMMVRKGGDMGSADDVAGLGQIISAAGGNRFDMLYEAWLANILSGPTTHLSYKMALGMNMGLEFSLQRGVEALVNLAIRDPKSAQIGEFKHILRGVIPGFTRGIGLGVRQFGAESELLADDVLNQQVEAFNGPGRSIFRPAISERPFSQFLNVGERTAAARKVTQAGESIDDLLGKLGQYNPARGRVIRLPHRVLYFVQGFYAGQAAQMNVAAFAYRQAKAEGLKGNAIEERIRELVATPNSDPWQRAVEESENLTFRQKIKTAEEGGNMVENLVAQFVRARSGSHLLGSQMPFVTLPYNLLRTGIRKTPFGTANLLTRMLKAGFFKMKDGKPFFESYPRAEFIKHLAEQFIAWTVAGLLWHFTWGDDDDDQKNLVITGGMPTSTDEKEMKKSVRELYERAYGGPTQIIIGGRNGVHIPYGKFEPMATVLGTIVNTLHQSKHFAKGEQGFGDTLSGIFDYSWAQVQEKTFLKNLQTIGDTIAHPTHATGNLKKLFMEALVPNLVRQPLRNLDDYIRRGRDAPAAYSSFPSGSLAEPRVDIYGRPVEKQGNAFTRQFFVAGVKPDAELQKADFLLLNWNRHHPQNAYAPSIPRTSYVGKDGKDAEMTAEQSTRFMESVGKRFTQDLRGQITQRMIDRPSEDDINLIKKIHTRSLEDVKHEMFPKPLARTKTTQNVVRNWLQPA